MKVRSVYRQEEGSFICWEVLEMGFVSIKLYLSVVFSYDSSKANSASNKLI